MAAITKESVKPLYARALEVNSGSRGRISNMRGQGSLLSQTSVLSGSAQSDKYPVILVNSAGEDVATIQSYIGKFYYNTTHRVGAMITNAWPKIGAIPPTYTLYLDAEINAQHGEFEIHDMPKVERVMDYKIQPDFKNFFYFNDTNEWVVYHTFDDESYYGGQFFPTIGAVICYDENDDEIEPSDVIYCPEVISNGIFEGAKLIIRWAANQTGKCCFNSGISASEKYDQSRLIFNISQGEFSADSNFGGYTATTLIEPARNRRSLGNINVEPFLTVDAINNGKIVSYSLLDDDSSTSFNEKMGKIIIKSDRSFLNELERLILQKEYNEDILNTIIISSNSLSSIMDSGALSGIQNDYLRTSGSYFIINLTKISNVVIGFNTLDLSNYFKIGTDYYATVENVGYVYDKDSSNPYQLHIQIHSKISLKSGSNLELNTGSSGILTDSVVEIKSNEQYAPMIKLNHCSGHYKIIRKSLGFERRVSIDGLYEQEYIIESPCCPGSSDARSEAVQEVGFTSDSYKSTQIVYPNSMVRAGSSDLETNERVSILNNDSFTYATVVPTNFNLETYRKNAGGGVFVEGSSGKNKITYPKQYIYRSIHPNHLYSNLEDIPLSDNITSDYNINLISGFTDDGEESVSTSVNVDIKLFVLYSNKKWRYNRDHFESYIGREHPAYIFEVDSRALINNYNDDMLESPSLPDLKRWFTAYCRGSAYTMMKSDYDNIASGDSLSELVLDIWDNKSLVGTDPNTDRTGNWRSLTPSQFDEYQYMDPDKEYDVTNFKTAGGLGTDTIDLSLIASPLDTSPQTLDLKVGDYIGIIKVAPRSTNFYRIVTADNNALQYVLDSVTVEAGAGLLIQAYRPRFYINKFRTHKFGGEKVPFYYSNINKYFDIKTGPLTPYIRYEFNGGVQTSLSIDSDSLNQDGDPTSTLAMYNFVPGFGVDGNGVCKFDDGTNYLEDVTPYGFAPKDLTRDTVFTLCSKIFITPAASTIKTATVFGFSGSGVYLYAYVERFSATQIGLSIRFDFGSGVQTKELSYFGTMSTGNIDVMLVKAGPKFIMYAKDTGAATGIVMEMDYLTTEDGVVMDNFHIGNKTAPFYNEIAWDLDKFYVFNRILQWKGDYNYFMIDEFSTEFDDVERYIDDDSKTYFRARVMKGRKDDASDSTNVKKSSVDRDFFTEVNPFTGTRFDWNDAGIFEEIQRFGMDYFRSESK